MITMFFSTYFTKFSKSHSTYILKVLHPMCSSTTFLYLTSKQTLNSVLFTHKEQFIKNQNPLLYSINKSSTLSIMYFQSEFTELDHLRVAALTTSNAPFGTYDTPSFKPRIIGGNMVNVIERPAK